MGWTVDFWSNWLLLNTRKYLNFQGLLVKYLIYIHIFFILLKVTNVTMEYKNYLRNAKKKCLTSLFLPKRAKSRKKAHVAGCTYQYLANLHASPSPCMYSRVSSHPPMWRWDLLEGNCSHPDIIPLPGSCHHDGAGTTSSQADQEQANIKYRCIE